MKKILLGNPDSLKRAVAYYGMGEIAYVCLTNSAEETQWNGIPAISFARVIQNSREHSIVITHADYHERLDFARQFSGLSIPFSIFPLVSTTFHIYGKFPDLVYEPAKSQPIEYRNNITMNMYRKMFQMFPDTFRGRYINIWVSLFDEPDRALQIARSVGASHIHAYCTMFPISNRVIAIPDYYSCYDTEEFPYPEFSPEKCKEASGREWTDQRAFWRGTIHSNFMRSYLLELGRRYPEYLRIEDRRFGNDISMPDQTKYKYLIDIGGQTWTNRLKVLLQLGRPVLMVDRPFNEWFFDKLEPMKHYVPIRQDLSDLIEKIQYLDQHPEVYENIVIHMWEFVSKWLHPQQILEDLKKITVRYDVEENSWWGTKGIGGSSMFLCSTAHKTKLVLDGRTGFLAHMDDGGMKNGCLLVYVKRFTGYPHGILFVVERNHRYYIQRINSRGFVILSDFPGWFLLEQNSNGTFSVRIGEEEYSYLSARKGGTVIFASEKYEWEKFSLELVE